MRKHHSLVVLTVVFFIVISCASRTPTPDLVGAQVTIALAVDGTLTALAPAVTATPRLTAPPVASPTLVPTVDCARRDVLAFCGEMRKLLSDERAIEDDMNQYTFSDEGRAASLEQYLGKVRENQDRVEGLRPRLFAMRVPREGRDVRDMFLDALNGRLQTYNLIYRYEATGDSSYADACNALNDSVDKTMLEVSDLVEDLEAWAEQANCL